MSSPRQRYKKLSRLSRKRLYAMIGVSLVVIPILAIYSFGSQPSSNGQPKAAIIDQLSTTEEFTNATFVETATNMLTAAGYQVTYYKGSNVNVDFYQTLPTDGYKILIFRVHSALRLENITTGALGPPLDFFTSEPYTFETHVEMQKLNQLDIVEYNQTSPTRYFGINPNFVYNAMEGNFQNATIMLEGCNGLDGQGRSSFASGSEDMLGALLYRGAKVIIGWNASVSVNHTDIATLDLIHRLLGENETVKEAVNATNDEIGPDPAYNNQLLYYPSPVLGCGTNDVGNYTISQGVSKSVATQASYGYSLALTNEGFMAVPLALTVKEACVSRKFRKKTSSVFQSV